MKNISNKKLVEKPEPILTYEYVGDENLGLEQLLFRLFEQITNENVKASS